jgi:predicted transcriptional regulator
MRFLVPAARPPISGAAIVALLTASLWLLIPAQAQQQKAPDQPQLTSKDVSNDDLEKFAAAYEAVEVIRLDLEKRMATVQDVAGANQLQKEANTQMIAAVQKNGLEPQRYNILSNAISNDKELLGRFQRIQKERAEKQEQQEDD